MTKEKCLEIIIKKIKKYPRVKIILKIFASVGSWVLILKLSNLTSLSDKNSM